MNIRICRNGHRYDSDLSKDCPYCERSVISPGGDTVPPLSGVFEWNVASVPQEYRELGEIGFYEKGAHGKIFTITPKPVPKYALKVIQYGEDDAIREQALREAGILESLAGCRHIIQFRGSQEKDGAVYVLEEYCEPFLSYWKKKLLRFVDVVQMANDICEALKECREKGFYHLDVQPKNLFVDENGTWKIGDFSVSAQISEVENGALRKKPMRGTLAYIAPEIFVGRRYSESSELYSLGLVLYVVLNGMQLPLMDEFGKDEAISQRLSGTEFSEPKCPIPELNRFVMKACAYDKEDRFPSYEAFEEELLSVIASIPSEALKETVTPARIPMEAPEESDTGETTLGMGYPQPSAASASFAQPSAPAYPPANEPAPPDLSSVRFTAVAPKKIIKGEYLMLDIVMYEEQYRAVVDQLIREAEEPVQETGSGYLDVRKNTEIRIELTSPDIGIDDDTETGIWTGKHLNFSFAVEIPEDFQKKQILFVAKVYFDDILSTRLKFVVKAFSLREQKIQTLKEDVLSAFISYASEDRSRVAALIQGMQKARPDMDIFFDVESLRSGDNWEETLKAEIARRDTLYLCWSLSAKKSEWVDREWRYAYETKGADCIEPLPIDSPDICPPPEELSGKHFNDRLLYLIR